MKKRFMGLTMVIMMLVGTTGYRIPVLAEDDDGIIRIGVGGPMTGPIAANGQGSQHAIDMAVEEINALGGFQIEILNDGNIMDDASDSKQAINVYNALMSEDPDVIVGEYNSACSLPMAELAQEDGMVMVVPGATNYAITEIGDYIFRTCFIDPYQGKMASKFAVSQEWKSAAVIYAKDDDYSNGLKDAFVSAAEEDGIEVVYTGECTTTDTDFTAQVSQAVATGADMIFFPCFYDVVPLLVQQARDVGFEGAIVGGDAWDGVDTSGYESYFDNTYYTNHYSSEDESEAVQNYVSKFTEKYGDETLNACSALYYDSIYMVYQAATEMGATDTESIKEGLTGMTFSGVTGTFTLNETGDPEKNVVINEFVDGDCKWFLTLDAEGNVVE